MQKKAHITCRPGVKVGDEVIGLCGKVFTMETVWDDIPAKHRICRKCVDTALAALTDADRIIESARICTSLTSRRLTVLAEVLDDSVIDGINERDQDHLNTIRERLAEQRKAKTCTCTWDGPDFRVVDDECPIHSGVEGEPEIVVEPEQVKRGPGGRPMEDTQLPEPPVE